MGSPVFGNEFFDQWLNQKTNEIMTRIEGGHISTEDMLILSLKAQVNHFHHMDIEFRDEFRSIDRRFEEVQKKFDEVDKRFEQVDKRFEQVDKRFDRLTTILMWGFGLFISSQIAIFLKL